MAEKETLEALARQIELFERAAAYSGHPREKIVALGEAEEIYFRLHPRHYMTQQTIRMASQIGQLVRTGEDPLGLCDRRLISLLMQITLAAIRESGPQLKSHRRPTELVFTLWSLASGTRALMGTGVMNRQFGAESAFGVARDASEMLLDALGWAPLSHEWNYNETRERVRRELFEKEWREVRERGEALPPGILREACGQAGAVEMARSVDDECAGRTGKEPTGGCNRDDRGRRR
jgi:hypothetical protein